MLVGIEWKMSTEAAIAASLQRPESDLDGSSSYVPSLASPTTRDSLDEGYDPDETLQVTVYDNEEIKIKSTGMYYSSGKNLLILHPCLNYIQTP